MDKLEPPQILSLEGNVRENWRRWRQEFELYLVATESDKKSEKIKSSILLTCIGKDAREVYNTFTFAEPDDNMKVGHILEKFTEYCNPRKNITFLRYQFFSHGQVEGQPFDQFVTALKKLAADCEFGDLKDSLIRDRIVCGTTDSKLRERYLRETELSLNKAIQLGQAAEETRKHASELHSIKPCPVDAIDSSSKVQGKQNSARADFFENCRFCGRGHRRGSCFAYNKRCNSCGSLHHFARFCPQQKPATSQRQINPFNRTRAVREVHSSSRPDQIADEQEFFIGEITSSSPQPLESSVYSVNTETTDLEWTIHLETNGTPIKYKLDTGSQVNLLPKSAYLRLRQKPQLHPANVKLTAYNGTSIPVAGKCILNLLNHDHVNTPTLFIIAETNSVPIIGLSTCQKLNLVTRVMTVECKYSDLINEYSDCFGEIGSLSKLHHLTVDSTFTPVIQAPRKIPFALRNKLKVELDRMERLGVISKVNGPTDWVSNLVLVEKSSGQLRVCLDPRDLNKAIKRHHYQLPTAEDIIARTAGAKYFSKLDASSGYWQLLLDEQSSKLLTFHTPFGRYSFKRLPFGINCASEIFQAEVAEILEGLDGCANVQDDILVWGETKQSHDSRLREVLSRIRSSGLKLNPSKCVFGVDKITYLGHLLTADGVKPDPRKVSAICDMPAPRNKLELQRFLGMVTYLGKFLPNLSTTTAPLRELLEKDTDWSFDAPQEQAFLKLKSMVTDSPVLKYFDPTLPIRVSSDSSKSGIGATLEQKHGDYWCPVAYASRSMSPAECNYSQIEKEILSIVFACERFNDFLYGQDFLVENDHKPLQALFLKPILKTPPRIQRFLLRLQKYKFTMKYIPGDEMTVSDALSRAYPPDTSTPEVSKSDMTRYVHSIITNMPISNAKLLEFQNETSRDHSLQKLKEYVQNGWPEDKKALNYDVQPYYQYRHDITFAHGILLKNERIIVPKSMRAEMRTTIHAGHLGIEKSKARAREALFWPGMTSEITNMIDSCSVCAENRHRQQKEHLIPHEIPEQSWVKVGTDLFHFNNKSYLLVVDYYSKFFEVSLLTDTLSSTIITHLKSIFARHGIPKVVISDNGPQFSSHQFQAFANQWDFEHLTSSPTYPQSNGMAERAVQTVKGLLKKALQGNADPYLALLNFRTSPAFNGGPSPAFKLYQRNPRTLLPSVAQATDPHKSSVLTSSYPTKYYNSRSKDLPPLHQNDTVRIHTGRSWSTKAKVVDCDNKNGPRSYIVETENGSVLRRNRRDLLRTKETFDPSHDYDQLDIPEPVRDNDKPQPVENTSGHELYKTRYGRTVNRPHRFGYDP